MPKKLILYFLILIWVGLNLKPFFNRHFQIWVLNVGQGESILLKEPSGKTLLFDGGPDESVLSELGSVLPPWQRQLDTVVLSHSHLDHIRGLIAVLDRYKVKELWLAGPQLHTAVYQAFTDNLRAQKLTPTLKYFPKTLEKAPPTQTFGQAAIQIYFPLEDLSQQVLEDQHQADLVLKVSYHTNSILLTGDLDEGLEKSLLQACQKPACSLAANILQVPHHGSKYGLYPDFLDAIKPSLALIPVGIDNKFKHPAPETLKKLTNKNIPIYRTDQQGRLHLQL